jgi:hypothetical protein
VVTLCHSMTFGGLSAICGYDCPLPRTGQVPRFAMENGPARPSPVQQRARRACDHILLRLMVPEFVELGFRERLDLPSGSYCRWPWLFCLHSPTPAIRRPFQTRSSGLRWSPRRSCKSFGYPVQSLPGSWIDEIGQTSSVQGLAVGQDRLCFPTLPPGAMKESADGQLAEL